MRRDPVEVAEIVGRYYGFPLKVIEGRRRTQKIVEARHMAMYLCLRYGSGFAETGRALARDHTTILHGHKQAGFRIEREKEAARDFKVLCDLVEDPAHMLADRFPPEIQPRVLQICAEAAAKGQAAVADHLSTHLGKLIGDLK